MDNAPPRLLRRSLADDEGSALHEFDHLLI
jgi:hypothetical protein